MTQKRAASSNTSATRHFLPLCEPMIITFREAPQPTEASWQHLLSRALELPWSTLRRVAGRCGCHMRRKDLIGSPVRKYSGALRENSLCEGWWEPWRWHREACGPVSSSRCSSNQHSAPGELLLLHWHALTRWLTRISSITSNIHSVPQHHTRHAACCVRFSA